MQIPTKKKKKKKNHYHLHLLEKATTKSKSLFMHQLFPYQRIWMTYFLVVILIAAVEFVLVY